MCKNETNKKTPTLLYIHIYIYIYIYTCILLVCISLLLVLLERPSLDHSRGQRLRGTSPVLRQEVLVCERRRCRCGVACTPGNLWGAYNGFSHTERASRAGARKNGGVGGRQVDRESGRASARDIGKEKES